MKNYCGISLIVLLIISIFFIHSCRKDELPVLTTAYISDITPYSANCGGTIIKEGSGPVIARGVCWATTKNPTTENGITYVGHGTGTFSCIIQGLSPGILYHVRAYATNTKGTAYGNDVTFTSLADIPFISLTGVSDITQTTATASGDVGDEHGASVSARGVCWSTMPFPLISDPHTIDGSGTGSFTSKLTSLKPGTEYYLRAYATNITGTAYSDAVKFTTSIVHYTFITSISSITTTSAVITITITSDGDASDYERGINFRRLGSSEYFRCERSTPNGSGFGTFTNYVSGLVPEGHYEVKAFLLTIPDSYYPICGGYQTFTTLPLPILFNAALTYGNLSDIDGNSYKTIQIGTQTWMSENLKTIRYNDGSAISNVQDSVAWSLLTSDGYCENSNVPSSSGIYGKLYNWYAVSTNKLCPSGWHVPITSEWDTLSDYLGNDEYTGLKLREAGTDHWESDLGTNESGFTAIPGQFRDANGKPLDLTHWVYFDFFESRRKGAFFWSGSESDALNAWSRSVGNDGVFANTTADKNFGYSVRCIKDY
jgi:uncharacterized protein (TIGR02145 family)